jgi:hypothetical protein
MDYKTFVFLRTKYIMYVAKHNYIVSTYDLDDIDTKIMITRLESLINKFKTIVARRVNR